MKLLLATKNRGKIKEIIRLLKGQRVEVLTLDDFPGISLPKEDRSTFKGNALKKARVAGETGLAAISDDSGLCVDALGGRPGVLSARYAGDNATDEENLAKLLLEMKDVPEGKRTASFVCVIALVLPSGKEKTFEGRLEGVIAAKPKGRGGFGYDPVFFLPGKNKTLAELKPEEKNLLSHRGAALKRFKKNLPALT
ncbi:MAG TPA: XTP/dITP diphosphatase [Thermodesulfobacteriota bacterium]|nr:XTP/dITP diphosphatase [Thermodesulfobacteriota bacterium]